MFIQRSGPVCGHLCVWLLPPPPLALVRGPAIDGAKNGLVDMPINLLRNGQYNKVPTIMGMCRGRFASSCGVCVHVSWLPSVVSLLSPVCRG